MRTFVLIDMPIVLTVNSQLLPGYVYIVYTQSSIRDTLPMDLHILHSPPCSEFYICKKIWMCLRLNDVFQNNLQGSRVIDFSMSWFYASLETAKNAIAQYWVLQDKRQQNSKSNHIYFFTRRPPFFCNKKHLKYECVIEVHCWDGPEVAIDTSSKWLIVKRSLVGVVWNRW